MQADAPCLEGAFPRPSFDPQRDAPPSRDAARAEASPVLPPSFTATLLRGDGRLTVRSEVTRFATGLGLAALYGLALGAREGGSALLIHAAGVPLALLLIAALGVPALYIVLALFDAPIDPARAASAAARSAASTGLVLGGLAPAAALFVVTSDSREAAALAGALGLAVGGVLGLRAFLRDIGEVTSRSGGVTRFVSGLAFGGFTVFATALAIRVWFAALPLFGGAS